MKKQIKEMTTRQTAERLEESDRLIRLWCQQGRFPNAHLEKHPRGDYWLIPESDLDGFVKPKPGPVPKPKAEEATKPRKRTKAERQLKTLS
jgi:hypothetical protein